MDTSIAVYAGIGVAAGGLVFVGWVLGQRTNARSAAGRSLLTAIIEGQPSGTTQRTTRGVPRAMAPAGELARLEGHLRTAIFDPGARERLVKDALQSTRGDRAAAVRKVLQDLERENRRWS